MNETEVKAMAIWLTILTLLFLFTNIGMAVIDARNQSTLREEVVKLQQNIDLNAFHQSRINQEIMEMK